MKREEKFSNASKIFGQRHNLTLTFSRMALSLLLSIIVLLFSDYRFPYLIPLAFYFLLAFIAFRQEKKSSKSFISGNVFFLLDVILIFWASYSTGSQTSALLSLFGTLVVIYTLHRGRRMGMVAVVLVSFLYALLLIVEGAGYIPVAPLIPNGALRFSMPGGCLAGWMITSTAVGMSYYYASKLMIILQEQRELALSALEKGHDAIKKEIEMEQHMLTAQRLEGLGRLAGGVAHEFNNLLTVMLGYGRMAQESIRDGSDDALDIMEVITAAKRGKRLVEQLLFYSRSPQSAPELLSPIALVQSSLSMLNRLMKNDVKLKTSSSFFPGSIQVDRMLMEQVLVNLVNNAVDAMTEGGTLTLAVYRTKVEDFLTEKREVDSEVKNNSFVCIEVRDEGMGMDEEEKTATLEPFYTTKEDTGTGLGLFMVREAIEQHGGFFKMDSAKGSGTSAKIFLPLNDLPENRKEDGEKRQLTYGDEKILLVEDEEMVREFAFRALSRIGYSIVVAKDAETAREIFDRTDDFEMLLTDVVLPGKSGYELAEEISSNNPKLKVLLMSGYSAATMNRLGIELSEINLIKKPFTLQALLERVRKTLDDEGIGKS